MSIVRSNSPARSVKNSGRSSERAAAAPCRRGRPKKPGAGVPHLKRPAFQGWTPVHVTLRVIEGFSSLRGCATFRALHAALTAGNQKPGFRLIHYAVQKNHIHLLVEADCARSLTRGVQSLTIRLARTANRRFRRHGRVFRDRYHSRLLRDAAAARNALRYVMNNARRHCPAARRTRTTWLDPCSSAPFFLSWSIPPGVPSYVPLTRDRVLLELGDAGVPPRTALLTGGWRRAGPIEITHVPGPG